jgi:hypothetical protein
MTMIKLMKEKKGSNWDARRGEISTLAKQESGFDDVSSESDALSFASV